MAAPWHVYLLRCADDSLYCGITTDLERRVAEHNGTRTGGAKYTRGRRPVTLSVAAVCSTHAEAARLEALIKALPRKRKEAALREAGTEG